MLVFARDTYDLDYNTDSDKVFDGPVNRSPFPVGTGKGPNAYGCDDIDCGVANFGMVRMCVYRRPHFDLN
jgi:hypothetical protein